MEYRVEIIAPDGSKAGVFVDDGELYRGIQTGTLPALEVLDNVTLSDDPGELREIIRDVFEGHTVTVEPAGE